MKSPRHVVPMVVALTLAAMLSGCSKKSSPTGLDSLDQSPPLAPTQLTVKTYTDAPNPVLEWAPSPSANVAGYRAYQYSPNPDLESAYVLIAETDAHTTRCNLPVTDEPATLYYRLRAVSSTGVQSEWSALVQVTEAPPLPDDPRPVKH